MKRNIYLLIGLATTLLFCACDDRQQVVSDDEILIENGRIRIPAGCGDDSKPTFYNKAWRFNDNDKAWVNNKREPVFPFSRRLKAHIWADVDPNNIYKALFPAVAYTDTILNFEAPTVQLYPRVRVMPRTVADTVNPGSSVDRRVIPMTAYLFNPNFNGRFYFRNTMSLVGPKFLYGEGFGDRMMDFVGTDQLEFPPIEIDSITIEAKDGHPLWGDGYVSNPFTNDPTVVIPHVAGHQRVTYFGDFETLIINTSPTRDAVPNAYLPIIPTEGKFIIYVYFHCTFEDIGTRRFCYTKESSYPITFPRSAILNTNILMDSQADFNNYVTVL